MSCGDRYSHDLVIFGNELKFETIHHNFIMLFSDVGEIEVMTSQATSDLSSAVDTVNTTIKLLGVQTVSKFGGKLMTYLSQNNPQLFHKIKQGLHGK